MNIFLIDYKHEDWLCALTVYIITIIIRKIIM